MKKNEILEELLKTSPELESQKDALEKAITILFEENPDIKVDKNFKVNLKKRLAGYGEVENNRKKKSIFAFFVPVFTISILVFGAFYIYKDMHIFGVSKNTGEIENMKFERVNDFVEITEDDLNSQQIIPTNFTRDIEEPGNNREITEIMTNEQESDGLGEVGEILTPEDVEIFEETEKVERIIKKPKVIIKDGIDKLKEDVNIDKENEYTGNNSFFPEQQLQPSLSPIGDIKQRSVDIKVTPSEMKDIDLQPADISNIKVTNDNYNGDTIHTTTRKIENDMTLEDICINIGGTIRKRGQQLVCDVDAELMGEIIGNGSTKNIQHLRYKE